MWLVSLIGLTALSCSTSAATSSPNATPPPLTLAAPTASADATTASSFPSRTPVAPGGVITLTLWTTEDLAPGTLPNSRILRNQFDAFTSANPNIHIQVVLKQAYGKGGLLDFLQTTSAVAPAQLPDLTAIDLSEVPLAAQTGLLQPLDSLLPAELIGDQFPFAYRATQFQGRRTAIPYAVDVQHLVYNRSVIKKPPQTWDDVLKQKTSLILPLGGDDAFVAQYAAIAPLGDTSPQLDSSVTTLVLSFFKRARDLGLLNDASFGLKNPEDAWPLFAAGQTQLAQIPASRYLAERERSPDIQFAPIPTRDGKIAARASGWALAITTNDPARQAAAARLIQWIFQSDRLAAWLRAARRLPATRSNLAATVDSSDYVTFLRDALENAVYLPRTVAYVKASDAWRTAMANVWKGQVTPEEAARALAAATK